jgi:peptide/nickel transport system substrate-binding protein
MGGRSLRVFLASMAAVALVAAGCAKKSTTGSASPTTFDPNGSIVFNIEQEPANFNVLTSDGNNFNGLQLMDRLWPSVYHADAKAQFFLDSTFMDSVTQTSTNPQTIVYNINHKALWQDGTPINADDFIYNWQAQSGLPQYTDVGGIQYDAASNTGYSQISSITFSPDKFTVTTTYTSPFPDWKSLFTTLAPAHIMKTVGWNKGLLAASVNANTVISGGPFQFVSYTPGKDFIVKRNPKYWGAQANLATIDYRFIVDSSQVEPALANNEINAAYPQPQLDLVAQLKSVPGVVQDQKPGLQFEHLDFNLANPFLADVNLRKAIALAVDRKELIAKTVGQFAKDIVPDNNRIYVPNQAAYRDTSSGTTQTTTPGPYDKADLAGAKALLTANGYTFADAACCGSGTPTLMKGGKAVTLRIASTSGNALRQSEESFVVNALAPLGIKVTEVDTPKLAATLSAGDFDMIIFAWVLTPVASGSDAAYQTKTKNMGGSNYGHYSNPQVDKLIAMADVAPDTATEAELYNQADALMWKDMATLPLFQKPTLLVYQNKYKNLQNNITNEGPAFNAEQWGLLSSR